MTGLKVDVKRTVTRGPETWTYVYVALAVVLGIEGVVVALWEPVKFPWNVTVFLVVAAFTIWMFLDNAWVHDKLVRLKNKFESKAR
jgi:hypothetical protein